MRKTKIIATIGPASESEEMIRKLALAGMNVARLNFSHGTYDQHSVKIERIKKSATLLKYSVLKRSIAKYAGKMITLSGWMVETRQAGDEYVVRLAVNRTGRTFKDYVYIICKSDPALAEHEHVRMYGTLSENLYIEQAEGGGTEGFPRFELLLFERLD